MCYLWFLKQILDKIKGLNFNKLKMKFNYLCCLFYLKLINKLFLALNVDLLFKKLYNSVSKKQDNYLKIDLNNKDF